MWSFRPISAAGARSLPVPERRTSLTIRIERRETEDGLIVELHGWLREDVLGEFESACGSVPGPIRLDLSRLAGADEAGLGALRSRAHAGTRLEGVSPYIRLLLESVDRA
jgi:hypothetical protein